MEFSDNANGARPPGRRGPKKTKSMDPGQSFYNHYNPYNQPGSGQSAFFDDTSSQGYSQPNINSYYNMQQQTPGYSIPAQFLSNPVMADMAMQYGQNLMGQGKELVDQNLEKYVAVSKLKYYFAVDTSYVLRKLGLLLFPFSHTDWSVKYSQDEPVQPQHDINAPDLYIPLMAFVTYILTAGMVLGIQDRFTPEVLGMQSSSALVWLILELTCVFITLYIMNIKTALKTYDLLAFSSYKFVGMVLSLLASLVFYKSGYYITLIYCSITLAFFLIRTLKVQILPESNQEHHIGGSKRRTYLLLFMAGIQPMLMWWLTYHLAVTRLQLPMPGLV